MIRWRASLRSWLGALVGVLIAFPRLGAIVTGDGWWFDWVVAAAATWLTIVSAAATVAVGDLGVAVRPGIVRLAWVDIERFETKTAITASVRAVRRDRRRGTSITGFGISTARARELTDRLNAELSASRSG